MKSSEEKISVILPIYIGDKPDQIKDAVDSLLCQTHPADEIIIIADGPISASTNKLVQNYETDHHKIRRIALEQNMGLSHALNTGIKQAKNSIIARMDADDISLPNRFEIQLQLLNEKKLDLVGGQILEFGSNKDEILSKREVPIEHAEIIRFMKLRSPFSHPTILFRKSLFEKVNGYSEFLAIEDYDFFVRCHINKANFGNTEETVLLYRMGSNYETLSRRRGASYAKNELELYKEFYRINYFSRLDFIKSVFLKIPLRFLPLSLFTMLYKKSTR